MTKLEYSDFYKFLSSLGIVLISLALLLPWLFLREPFDTLINTSDLSALTPAAQLIITTRQTTALWFLQNIAWISIILVITGLVFLVLGIVLWAKKQQVLDQRDELETAKLKHEVTNMTNNQVVEKVIKETEEELQTVSKLETYSRSVGSVAGNYLRIESLIIEKLTACFGTEVVLPNRQVQDKGYDVILFSERNKVDIIFEIKASMRGFEKSRMELAIEQLRAGISTYTNTTERPAKGIVLFISPDIQSKNKVAKFSEQISERSRQMAGESIKAYFLTEQKLNELSCQEIENLVYS